MGPSAADEVITWLSGRALRRLLIRQGCSEEEVLTTLLTLWTHPGPPPHSWHTLEYALVESSGTHSACMSVRRSTDRDRSRSR